MTNDAILFLMRGRKQTNETNSILDIETILTALRESPEGLSARDLAERLKINRTGQKARPERLNLLKGTGLRRRYGKNYRWSHSNRALVGHIRQRRRKIIHFIPVEIEEQKRGRIRIEPEDL